MSYPPYPGTHEPAERYPSYVGPPAQSASGLATAAAWVAGLYALFEFIEAGLAWNAQGRYHDALERGEALPWTPYDFTVFAWFGILIAAYVVTCLWLSRVRTNAEALCPTLRHTRSSGWVWGGWLVPFVSFWIPFHIVRDVSRNERGTSVVPGLRAWWTFWLLSFFVERIGLAVVDGQSTDDPNAFQGLGLVETSNAVLTLVALVLWIRIIRRIGRLQNQLMGITG